MRPEDENYGRDCGSDRGFRFPVCEWWQEGQDDGAYLTGGLGLTEVTGKNTQHSALAYNSLEL